jgi:hypothetical protein
MRAFEIGNYCIASVRDGQSEHKKDKALEERDINTILVIYRHDVYTYYYAIPKSFKKNIPNSLLNFFYDDNYDYTDEQLNDFKMSYSEYFNEEV